jgi:hypothetical protein
MKLRSVIWAIIGIALLLFTGVLILMAWVSPV